MIVEGDNMSLGEKILKLRKQKGLSQEELGDKIKVTRQTISNWELNETSPNPEQLKSLSKELDISIDQLLDNDINNILVEKVSNTEKLSGTILKLLKTIIIVVICIVAIWFILIVGRIIAKNVQDTGRDLTETIVCKLYGESHSLSVTYQELTGKIIAAGGDTYFTDILDLDKYDDAHQILNIINDYVKKNGGTCFRIEEDELSDMITMYIDNTTKTNTGATVVIEEDEDYEFTYGEAFKIEEYDYSNNVWSELNITGNNYGFNDIGYIASPDKPLRINQNWENMYGPLPKGLYRIVKDAMFKTGSHYTIWAEFIIE